MHIRKIMHIIIWQDNKDDWLPSNDDGIEWNKYTLSIVNNIKMYQISMIFVSFPSAVQALSNGTKIIKIHYLLRSVTMLNTIVIRWRPGILI